MFYSNGRSLSTSFVHAAYEYFALDVARLGSITGLHGRGSAYVLVIDAIRYFVSAASGCLCVSANLAVAEGPAVDHLPVPDDGQTSHPLLLKQEVEQQVEFGGVERRAEAVVAHTSARKVATRLVFHASHYTVNNFVW
jgi:hypothetical protein